jgi:uncharacterized RDD family membrane protein YckC
MTPPTGWTQPPAGAPGDAWSQRTQVGPAPGVVFGGFWIRFVAFYVDAILVESIVILLVLAFIPSIAGVLLVSMIVMPAYFIGFWATTGQTIGMKLFGLRVVRNSDGGRLGFGGAVLRLAGFSIACLPLYLGLIWVAFDARKRGWHDLIAGSAVIRRTR